MNLGTRKNPAVCEYWGCTSGPFAPGPAGWSLSSGANPAVSRRSRQARGSGRAIKNGKNYKKNRFSLQQLPKKGHFLKEMHKKKNRLRRKKKSKNFFAPSARYSSPPRVRLSLPSTVLLPLYLSLVNTGSTSTQMAPRCTCNLIPTPK